MKRNHFSLTIMLITMFSTLAFSQSNYPETIALPNAYQPEGVAAGTENTIYAGSLANGAIYQADVGTGEGSILVEGEEGRITVGLTFDERTGYLYAAGGNTGNAYVFGNRSGGRLFVNEVSFLIG